MAEERSTSSEPVQNAETSSVDQVCHEMESINLGMPRSDAPQLEIEINKYKERIQHLEKILSEKQDVLDNLKEKYNSLLIEFQQLKKEQKQPTVDSVSSNRHPGSDICGSPSSNDSGYQSQIQQRDFTIAELHRFVKQYYDLVLKTDEEKKEVSQQYSDLVLKTEEDKKEVSRQISELSRQLEDGEVQRKILSLKTEDLVRQKDDLYHKLSQCQLKLDATIKENDTMKEKYLLADTPDASKNMDVEHFKAQIAQLERENESQKKHAREQEEKIEKLTVRCGKAEDDIKRQITKEQRHIQPADNDFYFKSLDEKDAEISRLHTTIYQRNEEIEHLKHRIQMLSYNTSDENESYAIKEQLKAFQDDYLAECREKQRIVQELQETKKRLFETQHSNDHGNYPAPGNPHVHAPIPRQYSQQVRYPTGRHDDVAYHDTNRPHTRLPQPIRYNTIPPRDYSYDSRQQSNYYPDHTRHHLPTGQFYETQHDGKPPEHGSHLPDNRS